MTAGSNDLIHQLSRPQPTAPVAVKPWVQWVLQQGGDSPPPDIGPLTPSGAIRENLRSKEHTPVCAKDWPDNLGQL